MFLAVPLVTRYYHLKLEIWVLTQKLLIYLFPHLQLLQKGYFLLILIKQITSNMPHFNYKHILLQTLLQTNLDRLPEKRLVLN